MATYQEIFLFTVISGPLAQGLACEQVLLGVGGEREKVERACNDVSGIFISALNFSTQNADWWILNFVLTSLLFACVVLTTEFIIFRPSLRHLTQNHTLFNNRMK